MRIKEKGTKLQLLRVSYSSERGRSVETMFASLDKTALSIPAELRKVLEADEVTQLEAELQKRQAGDQLESKRRSLKYTANFLSSFRRALEDPEALVDPEKPENNFTQEKADALWAELDATRTALRKAGFARPQPEAKPKAAQGE
ncbi:hypothetical protein HK44_002125 [Pseudomonas fluorescens HK44]|uniref:Uncharacterized protein n=1 Tax=Pseudomonas fluorescens HK44 TaxID=1042209 RepID=A0A010STR4_PSEFL|nr:hypothetical protein [Pseudomonas fluorescens]EXF94313.1 hypothetical protein HK44_002125 [Pseudomonas fluorescens HK44]